MKLTIQVPAWNEAESLPSVLRELPRTLNGFDSVEILVVDDGSTDASAEVARAAGASVVRLPVHAGLARAFTVGIEAALRGGADVIVNTDADGQYDPVAIPDLVAPILAGDADMVLRSEEHTSNSSHT